MIGSFAEAPTRALRLIARAGGDDEGIPAAHARGGGEHGIQALRGDSHDEHATRRGIERKLREQATEGHENLFDTRGDGVGRRIGSESHVSIELTLGDSLAGFLRVGAAASAFQDGAVDLRDGAQRL